VWLSPSASVPRSASLFGGPDEEAEVEVAEVADDDEAEADVGANKEERLGEEERADADMDDVAETVLVLPDVAAVGKEEEEKAADVEGDEWLDDE
jgi:predicted ATP-dependent endonuclease of OLD family